MTYRFIGYAIVSDDGMLADSAGVIPRSMIVKADQDFFMQGLDAAAAVVHGKNSAEQPTSPARLRLIASREVQAIEPVSGAPNELRWNPIGASIDLALRRLGVVSGDVAIIGGTDIFGLFLPLYEVFYLTRANGVRLPKGRPVFPGVPERTPESLLAASGLKPGEIEPLDVAQDVTMVPWRRSHTA